MCVYCFHGSSKATAREFFGLDNAIDELLTKLQEDPQMELTLLADCDDVCEICPIKLPGGCGRGDDVAAQSRKLRQWDRVILDRLGLRVGQTVTAREVEDRIRQRIPDIGVICVNCTSAAPSGWQEFKRGIAEGLWPER